MYIINQHIDKPYAVLIVDGLAVAYQKQYFFDVVIVNKTIEFKEIMLQFDLAITKITDDEVFVTFRSKQDE